MVLNSSVSFSSWCFRCCSLMPLVLSICGLAWAQTSTKTPGEMSYLAQLTAPTEMHGFRAAATNGQRVVMGSKGQFGNPNAAGLIFFDMATGGGDAITPPSIVGSGALNDGDTASCAVSFGGSPNDQAILGTGEPGGAASSALYTVSISAQTVSARSAIDVKYNYLCAAASNGSATMSFFVTNSSSPFVVLVDHNSRTVTADLSLAATDTAGVATRLMEYSPSADQLVIISSSVPAHITRVRSASFEIVHTETWGAPSLPNGRPSAMALVKQSGSTTPDFLVVAFFDHSGSPVKKYAVVASVGTLTLLGTVTVAASMQYQLVAPQLAVAAGGDSVIFASTFAPTALFKFKASTCSDFQHVATLPLVTDPANPQASSLFGGADSVVVAANHNISCWSMKTGSGADDNRRIVQVALGSDEPCTTVSGMWTTTTSSSTSTAAAADLTTTTTTTTTSSSTTTTTGTPEPTTTTSSSTETQEPTTTTTTTLLAETTMEPSTSMSCPPCPTTDGATTSAPTTTTSDSNSGAAGCGNDAGGSGDCCLPFYIMLGLFILALLLLLLASVMLVATKKKLQKYEDAGRNNRNIQDELFLVAAKDQGTANALRSEAATFAVENADPSALNTSPSTSVEPGDVDML